MNSLRSADATRGPAPVTFVLGRSPAFARRAAAVMAELGRRDLRRPLAVLLMAVEVALLIWAGVETARQ